MVSDLPSIKTVILSPFKISQAPARQAVGRVTGGNMWNFGEKGKGGENGGDMAVGDEYR